MHTQLQNLLRQKRRWLRTFSYALEGRKQESGRGAEGVFFTFNSRRELVRNSNPKAMDDTRLGVEGKGA